MPSELHFVSGIRALEAEMFRRVPSREVMRRAAAETAQVAADMLSATGGRSVLAVAGPGNNGGDALAAAAMLRAKGFKAAAVFGGDAEKLSDDAKWAHSEWKKNGGALLDDIPDGKEGVGEEFDLVLDGIFGIGLTRGISGKYAEWIGRMNAGGFRILAVDAPSGLNTDTGSAGAVAVRAAATVTFLADKPGLRTGEGPAHCGRVFVRSLLSPPGESGTVEIRPDWDADLPESGGIFVDGLRGASRIFPSCGAHKGSRGTLVLIGGARGMEGALVLSSRAAAGLGAGKVYAMSLSSRCPPYDILSPDVMWPEAFPAGATAIGIGPGLGKSDAARGILREVLGRDVPLLADADALNLIALDDDLRSRMRGRSMSTIITPHSGEASRLLGCGVAEVEADRIGAARSLSVDLNADVVLKGAGSVLHWRGGGSGSGGKGGSGWEWGVNGSGNAGLARAGSGDVLTGFIGSFLAQTGDSGWSLEAGVYLHGAAADALRAKHDGIFGWPLTDLTPQAGRILNAG